MSAVIDEVVEEVQAMDTKKNITGRVYKICNHVDDLLYIGSTMSTLSSRMSRHRWDSKQEKHKNIRLYQHFHQHGIDNFYIVLIEETLCETKDHLRQLEEKYRREVGATLNQKAAYQTEEERKDYEKKWAKDHPENIKITRKKFNDDHKAERAEIDKKFRIKNHAKLTEKFDCPCGGRFTFEHKLSHSKTKRHQGYLKSLVTIE